MTTKQRAYLKSLAMTMDPIFPDRKIQYDAGIDPGDRRGIGSAGTDQDQRAEKLCGHLSELAQLVAERTRSQVVQVIGKKIVLYKEGKDNKKKIVLP